MRIPIIVPEDLDTNEPFRLGEWSVEIGDPVDQGDCLAELICPGLTIDLLSPASGSIRELLRQPEHRVAPGDVLGWIESRAEA